MCANYNVYTVLPRAICCYLQCKSAGTNGHGHQIAAFAHASA